MVALQCCSDHAMCWFLVPLLQDTIIRGIRCSRRRSYALLHGQLWPHDLRWGKIARLLYYRALCMCMQVHTNIADHHVSYLHRSWEQPRPRHLREEASAMSAHKGQPQAWAATWPLGTLSTRWSWEPSQCLHHHSIKALQPSEQMVRMRTYTGNTAWMTVTRLRRQGAQGTLGWPALGLF